MSLSKPVQKKQHTTPLPPELAQSQSFLTHVNHVSSGEESTAEEKDLLTTSSIQTPPTEQKRKIAAVKKVTEAVEESVEMRKKHPKGHRVHSTSEIWTTMDAQPFIRVTDTLLLEDVWFIPLAASCDSKNFIANVTMRQYIIAPHIKERVCITKMTTDDLLKVLYLNDNIQSLMQGVKPLDFDAWKTEKYALCVKKKGIDYSKNEANLCNFILGEDLGFTFYPRFLKGLFMILFRKTCIHSYKSSQTEKVSNPSVIKCTAQRGSFEYVIEARIFPLSSDVKDSKTSENVEPDVMEIPDSQPY